MPEPIENYISQEMIAVQKGQAVLVWGTATAIAFLWLVTIIGAPYFEANGVKSVSQPIYRFFSYMCHQISSRSFHLYEHQFAVCARCFGFYFGFLIGFIIYPIFRQLNSVDSFPRIWLFLAMIPMGIDVGLTLFGIWENTHLSRTVSGIILGLACAVFIIPALVEITQFLLQKLKKN